MQGLMDIARAFLRTAREEFAEGSASGNQVRVRDSVEKAWNAVVQATDHAMRVRRRVPIPGRDAHRDRRDFLEGIGRWDLAQKYTYFAERLHGDLFPSGAVVPAGSLRRYLDEAEDYLRQVEAV